MGNNVPLFRADEERHVRFEVDLALLGVESSTWVHRWFDELLPMLPDGDELMERLAGSHPHSKGPSGSLELWAGLTTSDSRNRFRQFSLSKRTLERVIDDCVRGVYERVRLWVGRRDELGFSRSMTDLTVEYRATGCYLWFSDSDG